MARIAILADSGCQLTSSEGVYIVPLQVTVGEKGYLDGIDINSEQVFNMMAQDETCMPKTSQPTSGDLVKILEKIKADGYDEVIGISIATGLSSTLSGMNLASDIVGIPLTLVDSKGTAGNQRYLIEKTSVFIKNGYSSEEIKKKLESMVENSGTIIMAPNLDHLKRGGRVTPAVALLGGMLKIVPVMKLNLNLGGKIDTLTKARTLKKARIAMVEDMIQCGVNSQEYLITVEHVNCEDEARELVNIIKEKIGEDSQVNFGLLPSVVGVHMGIGGIGCQYIKKVED